ncbi:n-acetylglutamate synthase [Priestia flexa]|nr:n-acetylglutamate synthase [Bacillus sp. 1780r2a1]
MICFKNRVFRSVENTANGEVSSHTTFRYEQEGKIIHATYEGGDILYGTLVGTIDEKSCLTFRYQHVNKAYEIRGGTCFSTPEVLRDGRIRLHEDWQWLDTDKTKGQSIIEELVHK